MIHARHLASGNPGLLVFLLWLLRRRGGKKRRQLVPAGGYRGVGVACPHHHRRRLSGPSAPAWRLQDAAKMFAQDAREPEAEEEDEEDE